MYILLTLHRLLTSIFLYLKRTNFIDKNLYISTMKVYESKENLLFVDIIEYLLVKSRFDI